MARFLLLHEVHDEGDAENYMNATLELFNPAFAAKRLGSKFTSFSSAATLDQSLRLVSAIVDLVQDVDRFWLIHEASVCACPFASDTRDVEVWNAVHSINSIFCEKLCAYFEVENVKAGDEAQITRCFASQQALS